MGGKSRKTGSVSKELIAKIKSQPQSFIQGNKCGTIKIDDKNNLGLDKKDE